MNLKFKTNEMSAVYFDRIFETDQLSAINAAILRGKQLRAVTKIKASNGQIMSERSAEIEGDLRMLLEARSELSG